MDLTDPMESYRYECTSANFDMLARAISDLFPEQTRFIEEVGDTPSLSVQWVAMRFGPSATRMTLQISFAPDALTRYAAMPPLARSRSVMVLRAYIEAALGSLEERYANGEIPPRVIALELSDEFA